MDLTREHWTKELIPEFQEYLKTFENVERKDWATNLLKTKLPVLCMKTADIKNIIKKISKGNYIEFLNLMIWEYYENTAINGMLINQINDFKTKKGYLDIYSSKADNWATCDLLTFNIKDNEDNYLNLSKNYINSNKPFVRRIGLYILFNFIDDNHIDYILNTINGLSTEEYYYVNMMNAWLLSECFILQRDKTLTFYHNNNLNKFTQNESIQKCRDSRRVSDDDKKLLTQYKK